MKAIVIILVSLLIIVNASSQERTDSLQIKNCYLQKSETQFFIGMICVFSGTAMIVVGVTQMVSNLFNDSYDTYRFIFYGGVALDLLSIPFFIISSENKKKALSVVINHQSVYLPNNNSLSIKEKIIPTLTLRLTF